MDSDEVANEKTENRERLEDKGAVESCENNEKNEGSEEGKGEAEPARNLMAERFIGQWGIASVEEMIDEVDAPDDCAKGKCVGYWNGDESAREKELPGDGD